MSNRKLLRKILRLKSLKITCFWFMHREKELHLAVKPYKNGSIRVSQRYFGAFRGFSWMI